MNPEKTIILTGGGTGGSVTPLLALVNDLQAEGHTCVWVGTHHGMERKLVAEKNLTYYSIASGKLRRYFSLQNIIDPFFILVGFFQSLSLLSKLKPNLVMTAGGFVSVPLVWAAWALRIPIIVHQQDIIPGLANRLMAVVATYITVTFAKSKDDYGEKAVWTGNPVREEFREIVFSNIDPDKKTIVIIGGGTGSEAINKLVRDSLSQLTTLGYVIHSTGRQVKETLVTVSNYEPHEFLSVTEMAQAVKQADLVITRAGMGTLSEVAAVGRATIIIPMPKSHQEANAKLFADNKAAIVLDQDQLTPDLFVLKIREVLSDNNLRQELSNNMKEIMKPNSNQNMLNLIQSLLRK